jgi:hypothetical protein
MINKILPGIMLMTLLTGQVANIQPHAHVLLPTHMHKPLTLTEQEEADDYEKWAQIALEATKQAFPEGEVEDCKYVGREEKSEKTVEDTFELTLQQNGDARQILVKVLYDKEKGQLLSVDYEAAEKEKKE